jgi:hypothetical protein
LFIKTTLKRYYCAGRIFLRKVGGGYIFIHPLLVEHFAAMDYERK